RRTGRCRTRSQRRRGRWGSPRTRCGPSPEASPVMQPGLEAVELWERAGLRRQREVHRVGDLVFEVAAPADDVLAQEEAHLVVADRAARLRRAGLGALVPERV